MEYVKSFRDLQVHSLSRELAKEVFEITTSFPAEERYSLTGQIRKSSRSIGAQIAESWAKRTYENHFVSKLTDADGEQLETQHWLRISRECQYISKEVETDLLNRYEEVGKMLQSMIKKAPAFCRPKNVKR